MVVLKIKIKFKRTRPGHKNQTKQLMTVQHGLPDFTREWRWMECNTPIGSYWMYHSGNGGRWGRIHFSAKKKGEGMPPKANVHCSTCCTNCLASNADQTMRLIVCQSKQRGNTTKNHKPSKFNVPTLNATRSEFASCLKQLQQPEQE